MAGPRYIAIEGVIGVGKTTLARLLQNEFNAELMLEVFEENPFLAPFYADPARYAFQTQIFFLLSRYRQQGTIHKMAGRLPILADYLFAKDQLFARLNLSGDELATYETVYNALSEHLAPPDLVIYLRARVDTLMARIAARDRPYERGMSRHYISDLADSYDAFFEHYDATPFLVVDTDDLNVLGNAEDLREIQGRVRAALQQGTYQPSLWDDPALVGLRSAEEPHEAGRRLVEMQAFYANQDGDRPDLAMSFLALQESLGGVARSLRMRPQDGRDETPPGLRLELADCLGALLRLANALNVDLESASLERVATLHQDRP